MFNHIVKVFIIYSIVGTQGCAVVIEVNQLVSLVPVIFAEVIHQGLELTFILYPERFNHLQPVPVRLTGYQPVDVGIKVKGDADGLIPIEVCIHQAGRLFDFVELIFQAVQVAEVGRIVFVPLCHAGVEAVSTDTDTSAEDGRLKGKWGKVTLHLINECFTQQLHVLNRGELAVQNCHRAHAAYVTVQGAQIVLQVQRNWF